MRTLTLLTVLLLLGCASPQEKARKRTMAEYRLSNAECSKHVRTEIAHLVAATRLFHVELHRWPYRLAEVAKFAGLRGLPIDELAFNDATFATMSDGSLEIQYEFNCARFDPDHPHLVQRSSVQVSSDR